MSTASARKASAQYALPHRMALHAFHNSLTNPRLNLSDRAEFCSILGQAVSHYKVKPKWLSQKLNVDLSTVNRWCNGKSAPHTLVREAIIQLIIDKLEFEIDAPDNRIGNSEVESKIETYADLAMEKALAAI
ncbi:hypothetical protein [Roseibium alexandrii]|uniref:hypothetical protein n=1 Tax=Roseibium alexandrii TaxID=388408 RepID=UPI0037510A8E